MNKAPYRLSARLLPTFLLAATLLGGCAPAAEQRQRFFWPPAQFDQPRIEYINFFQTEQDARRGSENRLAEAIFGKTVPQRLFARPFDVVSSGRGRVYVSDLDRHRVFVFDLAAKELRTLKRGGGADDFLFTHPTAVALDGQGHVYVGDAQMQEIHRFGSDEKYLGVFVAGGFERAGGMAFDSERKLLYVADTGAHQVKAFDEAGRLVRAFGRRGVADGEFNFPLDLDLDGAGNLYVLDAMNARVQVFNPEGDFLRAFGERGTAAGSFQLPKAIAVSPSGHVYVTDSRAHRFVVFNLQGDYLLSVGGEFPVTGGELAPGGFYLPEGIDVDSADAIWVVDSLNRMFHQFQYLTPEYLAEHPILPGQAAEPGPPKQRR